MLFRSCPTDYDPPPGAGSSEPVQLLRLLPVCSHTFHRDCLDSWLVVSGRVGLRSSGSDAQLTFPFPFRSVQYVSSLSYRDRRGERRRCREMQRAVYEEMRCNLLLFLPASHPARTRPCLRDQPDGPGHLVCCICVYTFQSVKSRENGVLCRRPKRQRREFGRSCTLPLPLTRPAARHH